MLCDEIACPFQVAGQRIEVQRLRAADLAHQDHFDIGGAAVGLLQRVGQRLFALQFGVRQRRLDGGGFESGFAFGRRQFAAGHFQRPDAERAQAGQHDQRRFLQFAQEAASVGQHRQRINPQHGVVVVVRVQLRMHAVPALLQQLFDQLQAVGTAGHAMQRHGRAQQRDGQAQIAAARQQVASEALDDFPLWRHGGRDGIAILDLGLAEDG